MTEFKLDKITSFIKHKKKDCQEPVTSMGGDDAELVCSSCPQGFMTAVGLLKHAQTIHKFKLFLERTSNVIGIQEVTVSPDETVHDLVSSQENHKNSDSLFASQELLNSLIIKDFYQVASSQMQQKIAEKSPELYSDRQSQVSRENLLSSQFQQLQSIKEYMSSAQLSSDIQHNARQLHIESNKLRVSHSDVSSLPDTPNSVNDLRNAPQNVRRLPDAQNSRNGLQNAPQNVPRFPDTQNSGDRLQNILQNVSRLTDTQNSGDILQNTPHNVSRFPDAQNSGDRLQNTLQNVSRFPDAQNSGDRLQNTPQNVSRFPDAQNSGDRLQNTLQNVSRFPDAQNSGDRLQNTLQNVSRLTDTQNSGDRLQNTLQNGSRFPDEQNSGDRLQNTLQNVSRFPDAQNSGDRLQNTLQNVSRLTDTQNSGDRLQNTLQNGSRFPDEQNSGDRLQNTLQNVSRFPDAQNSGDRLQNTPQNVSRLTDTHNSGDKLQNTPQKVPRFPDTQNSGDRLQNMSQNVQWLTNTQNSGDRLQSTQPNVPSLPYTQISQVTQSVVSQSDPSLADTQISGITPSVTSESVQNLQLANNGDNLTQIGSGRTFSSSLLNAIMKSGVIFPLVNKHLTNTHISNENAEPGNCFISENKSSHPVFIDHNLQQDRPNNYPTENQINGNNQMRNEVSELPYPSQNLNSKQHGTLPSVKLLLEAARRSRLASQGASAQSIDSEVVHQNTTTIMSSQRTNTDQTALFNTSRACHGVLHVSSDTNDLIKEQSLFRTSADNQNYITEPAKNSNLNEFNISLESSPEPVYTSNIDPQSTSVNQHSQSTGTIEEKQVLTKSINLDVQIVAPHSLKSKDHVSELQKSELNSRLMLKTPSDKTVQQQIGTISNGNTPFEKKLVPNNTQPTVTRPLSTNILIGCLSQGTSEILDSSSSDLSLSSNLNSQDDDVAKITSNSNSSETAESANLSQPGDITSQVSSNLTSSENVNPDDGDSDNGTIGCCDSKNCGVTVIPGTHEGLKKCCNAVVPKKRKRHFETKHTLSYRQKLKRRISSSESGRIYKNVDKKNSGTIFIDLEPNDDGTLSEKSSSNNEGTSTSLSGIGFQVSGLSRSTANTQNNPKGTVILQPGAIFSIPIAYSLTTQTDGTIRPLVISQHTFQSKPTTSQQNTSTTVNSSDATPENISSIAMPERVQTALKGFTDGTLDKSGHNLDSKLQRDEDDSPRHSRRRRYPTSRPFKCDKCDSAFNQRIHLKKHMSKHTGVKPFKCHQCNYSTVERSHLKVHIRIHTGEKPFKCTYCEYATAQNSTLKIHLKRHHKPSQSSSS